MIELELTQVPFSALRAWMSISPILRAKHVPDGSSALYLRGHHGKSCPLMKLSPLATGNGPVNVSASATLLRWTQGAAFVEACFDGTGLRFRGQGMGLALEPVPHEYFAVTHQTHPDQITVNILEARRQYRIERLDGQLEVAGLWHAETKDHSRIRCLPDEDGTWEIALDEYQSTWMPHTRSTFESSLATTQESFNHWLEATLDTPSQYGTARELAAYINWSSTVGECGLLRRPTMLMSKNWMSNVWSWDHCFNAMAAIKRAPELAWNQLLIMADHQDEHGCYPDSINDVELVFNFSKPPVHGLAVTYLLEHAPHPPSQEVLREMYASLCRWTRWWLEHRRNPGETLPHYLHGNDSGWDNSTMFDHGVPLQGPDLAAFLVLQLEAQSELARRLHLHGEAERWARQSVRLLADLIEQLWRNDHFVARLADGREVRSACLQYCLPVVLGKRLPEAMRTHLVARIRELVTDHGLATEALSSPQHETDGYWRGPIWAPSTYLIVKGLVDIGEIELAATIAKRFCDTCAAQGFAENFDAATGAGLRDRAYTWTASVFLLLAEWLDAMD